MPLQTRALAGQSAANAACIAREIAGVQPDFLREIGNFDHLTAAAVRLAEIEGAPPGGGFWEERSWEEACAALANHLATRRGPVPDSVFRRILGLTKLPPKTA